MRVVMLIPFLWVFLKRARPPSWPLLTAIQRPLKPTRKLEANPSADSDPTSTAVFEAARLENERHRREAQAWLNTEPLGPALILRRCMEPLRRLLRSHLEMGGTAQGTPTIANEFVPEAFGREV